MNNFIKDWRLYLISFLVIASIASFPWVVSHSIALPFSIDFMYLIFYYLAFFVLFLVSLILFFFGLGKGKIKGRKVFLVYYSLLFLITLCAVTYWLGMMLDKFSLSTFRFL